MSRTGTHLMLAALAAVLLAGCFGSGAIQRSYYVLHGVTITTQEAQPIAGHVRVRNMDTASIYEKFQIVVRRSPYELSYSETDVWAVKPNRMVADVIAQALSDGNQFSQVARELGELRPDYILSGELHAIEVYRNEDLWFAHLALNMQLSRFENGETLLTYKFDERKPVPTQTFSQAARAMSELLSTALDELNHRLDQLDLPRGLGTESGGESESESGGGSGSESESESETGPAADPDSSEGASGDGEAGGEEGEVGDAKILYVPVERPATPEP